MRPRISIRGSVRPSVSQSVRPWSISRFFTSRKLTNLTPNKPAYLTNLTGSDKSDRIWQIWQISPQFSLTSDASSFERTCSLCFSLCPSFNERNVKANLHIVVFDKTILLQAQVVFVNSCYEWSTATKSLDKSLIILSPSVIIKWRTGWRSWDLQFFGYPCPTPVLKKLPNFKVRDASFFASFFASHVSVVVVVSVVSLRPTWHITMYVRSGIRPWGLAPRGASLLWMYTCKKRGGRKKWGKKRKKD